MSDEVNDSMGSYNAPPNNGVEAFVEDAIAQRIEQINAANNLRLERFRLDAEKAKIAHNQHLENRPSTKLLADKSKVSAWNEKRIDLEGRLDLSEYQLKSMNKSILNNQESVIRAARNQVSNEFPEQYRSYQDQKSKIRIDSLIEKFNVASDELDVMISSHAPDRSINAAVKKVERSISLLEKAKGAESHVSDATKKNIQAKKAVVEKLNANNRSKGRELD